MMMMTLYYNYKLSLADFADELEGALEALQADFTPDLSF